MQALLSLLNRYAGVFWSSSGGGVGGWVGVTAQKTLIPGLLDVHFAPRPDFKNIDKREMLRSSVVLGNGKGEEY